MINDIREPNIYLINITGKSKRNSAIKVTLVVLIIIILILLISIANYTKNIISNSEVYKQYEEQLSNLKQQQEEERQAKIPKLTEQGRQNIENIYRSDTKRAFLTFDDGPSCITTDILDVLKQENVKATFFVLGSEVEKKPEIVKRIYDEGHYVANHGYSHVYENIYACPQAVLDEYNKCNDTIKKAIGVPEYNSYLFRFPGGITGGKYNEIKKQANELLKQNGIMHVDWNALTGDAETNDLTIDFELTRLKETIQNKNSIVILMHDAPAKKVTAEALPQIIAYLREQGYEFENFYEIIK